MKIMALLGFVLWIIAIIIIMATYGVLARPILVSELNKSFILLPFNYSSSLILSASLLVIGAALILFSFKKKKK